MKKFIRSLNEDEAFRVLNNLLDDIPDLVKTVYDIALKVVDEVEPDEIMDEVFCTLNALDMDDLSGRSGRTRYGYIEPCDAAFEIFEEALQPFIDEMKKNYKRAMPAVAKAYCIGIVKGLWKYENEATSDFSGWVEDAPDICVDHVVAEWKKGNPNSEDIAEVACVVENGRSYVD